MLLYYAVLPCIFLLAEVREYVSFVCSCFCLVLSSVHALVHPLATNDETYDKGLLFREYNITVLPPTSSTSPFWRQIIEDEQLGAFQFLFLHLSTYISLTLLSFLPSFLSRTDISTCLYKARTPHWQKTPSTALFLMTLATDVR